jgi:predicted metal-dependent phosphoesterase TrpH
MIDLHMHSMFSDGTFTPEELVAAGVRNGVKAMALTDHDTTAGVPRFLAAAEAAGMRAFSGVEVSAEVESGTLHVLGYGIQPEHPGLKENLTWIRKGRQDRNLEILRKLNEMGMALTYEEVTAYAGADVVARPHFAQAMMAKGYVGNKREAFDRFLARGKPAYVERSRMDASDTFSLIRQAGGLPVLAHPFSLKLSGEPLRAKVEEFTRQGLGGIEVYYPEHSPERLRAYLRLAHEFDLVATGGSDFHGAVSPGVEIGRGSGHLHVPDSVANALQQRLGTV